MTSDRPFDTPPPARGWAAVFLDVLIAPARAFGPLRERPRLLAPVEIVAISMLLLSLLLVKPPFGLPSPMIADLSETLDRQQMPEEHRQKVFEMMSGWLGYATGIAIVLGELALIAGIGLALSGVLALVPSPAGERFPGVRRLLSVSAYAGFVDVAEMLLKTPLYLAKGTFRVYTSPALFLSEDWTGSRLFRFLDCFDLFTLWKLGVLVVGVSVVAGRSRRAAAFLVLVPWLLSVALRVGLNGMFSGGVTQAG